MNTNIEEILVYFIVLMICGFVIYLYVRKQKKRDEVTVKKIARAIEEGRHEPVSLHPFIDVSTCIGSGACVSSCPEQDILGLVEGKGVVINATSCIGHGACFHSCPVEAIALRIGTETRGVDLPHINPTFETNMNGVFLAGEIGGMGLIRNSVEQGKQAVENIAALKKPKKEGVYDLIIIGAGPAGISGALTAKKHGLSFKILEQYTLGGTVYSFPRSKIVMTSPMNLPLYGKVKLYDTSKDELLAIWNKALTQNNITIEENTKVESVIPNWDGTHKITTNRDEFYYASNVLVAIGRRGTPRKLNIPGESLPKVYYRLLEPESMSNKDILVVGGGDSAIEAALLLMDNNRVTLSYRKAHFSRIKTKNRELIKIAQHADKLNIIFNSNLIQISNNQVIIKETDDLDLIKYKNDLVYIFAGGELPTKFLENAGVEITKRFGYIVKKHT